eukprot:g2571.t1
MDAAKAKKAKKKGSSAPPLNLRKLDSFWREELPATINGREEAYVTRDELIRIFEWKITRGKFRPLRSAVESNASSSIEKHTRLGFAALPDVDAAIDHVAALRGVGPATASAVLACVAGDQAPFMADEALEAALNEKRSYTAKAYRRFREALAERAETLGPSWTAERVGRALWAEAMSESRGGVEMVGVGTEGSEKKKKKSASVTDAPEATAAAAAAAAAATKGSEKKKKKKRSEPKAAPAGNNNNSTPTSSKRRKKIT